jgi:flagellar motor switch protein FliG
MSSPGVASNPLTGLQKVAIVLLSLGPTASGEILKQFTEDEVDEITSSIARLNSVSPNQSEGVLSEFQSALDTRTIIVRGGLEHARKILTEAFGEDQANRMVDRMSKAMAHDVPDFSNLRKVDPQQLAKFIQDEHPQTIALVLSHLEPPQAAALLSALPVEIRPDIAMRMAGLEQIAPEALRTIASVIGQKLRNLGELSREAYGGVRGVAYMFNRLDPNTCTQLLEALEHSAPELFENVRRFMFVFEDLLNVDGHGMKELLAVVDRKVLMIALKGTTDELRKHFMGGMSQRGADMFREDIAALGPVKLKEVDAAQQQIIAHARQLERSGVISLKNAPSEQYVN